MTVRRRYLGIATDDVLNSLAALTETSTPPEAYRHALERLGDNLAHRMSETVDLKDKIVLVVAGVEDVDSLGSGFIEVLTRAGADVRLTCLWMDRKTLRVPDREEVANIIQEYMDPIPPHVDHFVVLKSIVSSSCTIRTSLLRMLDETDPERIHVASPVMLKGARKRLEAEFPTAVGDKFEYWVLAIDGQADENGNVIPGIGGSVYNRMGFNNQDDKNFYMPALVESRMISRREPTNRPFF
ncbi:uracil phosphoribosyltransferase [Aminobacter ciceronei]|uniref:Uracil phosphoribosyltransferase n=1 Tax=Aminobacter ciceronei TaxID=150723 RepID=A0ABR6C5W4_9HYPH|nr:uracil phosphoribosyltransferase [Aminobacter ciceronei]MBA8906475.1 uracil phosphoribosyltransferase [Aminobacter ciceronei]MBA9020399.1 uracil phosphoribosyltransferase [Aminobacter ciceronei]